MKDDVRPHTGESPGDRLGVAKVRVAHVDLRGDLGEAPAVTPGTDESVNRVRFREQAADEVRADEARGSGDQSTHEAPQSSSVRGCGRLTTLSTM